MAIENAVKDRRSFGRRQTNMIGWVKIPGRPLVSCTVRNISEGGANLEFHEMIVLPYSFLLKIETETGVRGCEMRHNYGQRVGVQFVDTALVETRPGESWLDPKSTSHFR